MRKFRRIEKIVLAEPVTPGWLIDDGSGAAIWVCDKEFERTYVEVAESEACNG
jgi:hypothetical protein